MASPSHPLAAELVRRSIRRGFNLVGFVGSRAFDACQPSLRRSSDLSPGCGTIYLLGTGGSGFWDHLGAAGVALESPRPDYHPISDHCARSTAQLITWLREQGIDATASYPDDEPCLNFMQLAEMAGWGTISPVAGLLIHPEYGSWVSMRAAILLQGEPFGSVRAEEQQSFQPCLRCTQSCVSACPVDVFDGQGGIDFAACATDRDAGQCADGCEARRACSVGADHRYGRAEESFRHAYSLFSMRRHFELGG